MKVIERAKKPYVRSEVEKDTRNMYIFTDNTDRDSGKNLISPDSWYSAKYGEGHHYPTMTSAVIRGLSNAYPITTQHYYNEKFKGENGRWKDEDIEEFMEVIYDDFSEILHRAPLYDKIIFPPGGIFNSQIANISEERTPLLYEKLMTFCKFLPYAY